MMHFAINFSTQAAALVAGQKIQIDRFKCPDWPDLVAQAASYRPVAVHFSLKAGPGNLEHSDWEKVESLLESTQTPYVNLHLVPKAKDFPGIPPDSAHPAQIEQVFRRLLQDVGAVVKRFGAERVICENVPYYGTEKEALRPGVLPEVIRRLLDETGSGLLLDISHARIAAHTLDMDEREYMEQLPVERLRELHFTGLHQINGRLQDHLPALETDWPALEWVLEHVRRGDWARPWLLAFEYGGVGEKFAWRSDSTVIASQAPRLYAAAHAEDRTG